MKLPYICGLAVLATAGCQGTWRDHSLRSGRSERTANAKPSAEQADREPEPKISPETYLAAGKLAESRREAGLALAMYRKAIWLNSEYVDGYNCLGALLASLGEYRQAEEVLSKAVELAPEKAHLRNNLAFTYLRERRWKDAECELRRALELQPQFARARVNLAVALAQMGQYDQALDQFSRVLPPADAHCNMGLIYEANRCEPEAYASFNRALALNPQLTPAREGLQRLELSSTATARKPSQSDGVVRANCRVTLEGFVGPEAEPASDALAQARPTQARELPASPEPAGIAMTRDPLKTAPDVELPYRPLEAVQRQATEVPTSRQQKPAEAVSIAMTQEPVKAAPDAGLPATPAEAPSAQVEAFHALADLADTASIWWAGGPGEEVRRSLNGLWSWLQGRPSAEAVAVAMMQEPIEPAPDAGSPPTPAKAPSAQVEAIRALAGLAREASRRWAEGPGQQVRRSLNGLSSWLQTRPYADGPADPVPSLVRSARIKADPIAQLARAE